MQVMRLLGFLHNYCFIEKSMRKELLHYLMDKSALKQILYPSVYLRSILVKKSC